GSHGGLGDVKAPATADDRRGAEVPVRKVTDFDHGTALRGQRARLWALTSGCATPRTTVALTRFSGPMPNSGRSGPTFATSSQRPQLTKNEVTTTAAKRCH